MWEGVAQAQRVLCQGLLWVRPPALLLEEPGALEGWLNPSAVGLDVLCSAMPGCDPPTAWRMMVVGQGGGRGLVSSACWTLHSWPCLCFVSFLPG